MNVHLLPVIRMLLVPTLMVALSVHVILDTVETDLLVKVNILMKYCSNGFVVKTGYARCTLTP